MNVTLTNPEAERKPGASMFDLDGLDVYRLELTFIAWITPLLEGVSRGATAKTGEVRDHLVHASLSTFLNMAEGKGKRQRQVRAEYFDDAHGSVSECATCRDALVVKQAAIEERVVEGKELLLRIIAKLCGLIVRFKRPVAFCEDSTAEWPKKPTSEQKVKYGCRVSRTRTRKRTSRI